MVPCLLTLTGLQTRGAGLSASNVVHTGVAAEVAAPHYGLALRSVTCQSLSDDVVASPAGVSAPRDLSTNTAATLQLDVE